MYYLNHCRICPENIHCCIFKKNRGFVFVGGKDAKKIKKYVKKDYDYFLDNSKLPEKLIKSMKDEDPALEGALRYSQLKDKRLTRLKTQKDGKCIFLMNGKCCIYKVRPCICRMYPFWAMRLLNGRIKVIEHDENPKCSVVRSGYKISKKEEKELKQIYRNIEKENIFVKTGNTIKNKLKGPRNQKASSQYKK